MKASIGDIDQLVLQPECHRNLRCSQCILFLALKCRGGLSLTRNSLIRLTDRSDMTIPVYCDSSTLQQHVQHLVKRLVCPWLEMFAPFYCRPTNEKDVIITNICTWIYTF